MDKWVIALEIIGDNYIKINGLFLKSHQRRFHLQVLLTFPGNRNDETQREMDWVNNM